MTEKVTKVKFKILYQDDKGSYTYSNLRDTANEDGIYTTAKAFVRLQVNDADRYFRIVDSVLETEE